MQLVLGKAKVSDVTYLADASATVENVTNAMLRVLKADVAVIFYSGHGGSRTSNDPVEVDGKDEFLCLYDKPLVDNDIWNILQTSTNRIVTIFDCCHSETMFKTPITFKHYTTTSQTRVLKTSGKQINLLCWSACADNTYSYGTHNGGEFTTSISINYKPNMTYSKLWEWLLCDEYLAGRETIKKTVVGQNFEDRRVFR